MAPPTQERRFLSIDSPLGKDVLLLDAFQGRAELSRLFEFELELLSQEKAVAPADLVGKSVAFAVHPEGGGTRVFNGFVSRLVYGGVAPGTGMRRYRATVVPWLWFLTKRSTCRIFQDKTVVEIVEQVFSDAGFHDYETSGITGTYPKLEYCVQLGETDAAFVSRLLEEEGIFYSFRFEEGRHVMVLADSKVAYVDCETRELEFTEGEPSLAQVNAWEHRVEFVSGKWAHTDFNFTTPSTDLFADSPTVVQLPGLGPYERYGYPGRYSEKSHGEGKAKARMEAEETGHDVVDGAGGCYHFCVGGKFELVRHPFSSEEKKSWVLTAVAHQAFDGSYAQTGAGAGHGYSNQFRCIPDDVLYRPALRTPKPIAHGPQTAIVVGPKGEEIYTDDYGRIKVQFHWDRLGRRDEKSSCWIRVAQSTAGKKWGAQTLPRVGQEVVVEFLDGDPDRPLVTGAVYNANTMPPYALPANKTQSGIKSRSSKDAPNDAFNEIRFEDKKGSEHVFVHAQKDEHHRVRNDRHDSVEHDEHRMVAGDRKEKIEGDHHYELGGDRFAKLDGDASLDVGGDRKTKVVGADGLDVGGDLSIKTGGDHGVDAGGGHMIKAGAGISGQAAANYALKAGANFAVEGTANVHVKGGANVVIEAGAQITLKAGGAFVTVNPGGVFLSGPMVSVNSGGAAGSGSGCSPVAPGAAAAPDAPEDPVAPMEAVAADTSEAAPQDAAQGEADEAEWTKIESAPSSSQAAALESAAATGQPLCERCQ